MQKQREQSHQMSFGMDIDGRTVAEIREMLAEYPDDAVIESYTDIGQTVTEEIEFFRIVWDRTS